MRRRGRTQSPVASQFPSRLENVRDPPGVVPGHTPIDDAGGLGGAGAPHARNVRAADDAASKWAWPAGLRCRCGCRCGACNGALLR